MNTLDRIGSPTSPGICTRTLHESWKVSADVFAAHTTFVGVWLDGLMLATCPMCGSSLSFDPDGWSDADEETLPIRMACARTP